MQTFKTTQLFFMKEENSEAPCSVAGGGCGGADPVEPLQLLWGTALRSRAWGLFVNYGQFTHLHHESATFGNKCLIPLLCQILEAAAVSVRSAVACCGAGAGAEAQMPSSRCNCYGVRV